MKPILEIKNISKKYTIGRKAQPYLSIRDSLTNIFTRSENTQEFYALKDVSFDVSAGDSVAIIGKNGAGKSTLLKILSKITPPSSGKIITRGRIAALLEVGTGFHPELTGRENIFLNGSILGLKKSEIISRLEEIIDFSGVEKFLDTPLKHYSSGMQLRLAFAVASNLNPDILIIDEVLAVGDAEFQKKCIKKMNDISRNGNTLLYVSHNLNSILGICTKGILLNEGMVVSHGNIADTIEDYKAKTTTKNTEGIWVNENPHDKGQIAVIDSIEILDQQINPCIEFLNTDTITLKFTVTVKQKHKLLKIGFDLIKDGQTVFRSQQSDRFDEADFMEGTNFLFCHIPGKLLNCGQYYIKPMNTLHGIKTLTVQEDPILDFMINIDPSVSNFHGILNPNIHPGTVFPILEWKIN